MRTETALVVGAGPNGLTAAIVLAQAGLGVTVREARAVAGGAARSAELTLPGFTHDVMSAVYPMALSSPFFRELRLDVDWVHPDAPAAHPLDDGSAVMLERDVERTADGLGEDSTRYLASIKPLADHWLSLSEDLLAPLNIPKHAALMARFGWTALKGLRGMRGRALLAGMAAHSCLPIDHTLAKAVGLALTAAGHGVGWPVPRGGAGRLADALTRRFESMGGVVEFGHEVRSLGGCLTLCDVTPRQFARLSGAADQGYRYGPGAFKVDWALNGPVPWRAAECLRAATVHVGGTYEEIADSEQACWEGRICERPFCLVVQPSLFDPSRAPMGKHTLWAYCHVPNGCPVDMTTRIEAQIERFAPGFRERILARNALGPAALEIMNPNLVGGDLNGGAMGIRRFLTAGYRTALRGVYLCSSSTPPGGGVHGMCGYYAAHEALKFIS